MLHVLKIDNWKNIPPFAFYMTPLSESLESVRSHLLEMRDLGHLRAKYFIEKNDELQKRTIQMVTCDMTAQWLAGDELKQD
jgi:hypothetical protein